MTFYFETNAYSKNRTQKLRFPRRKMVAKGLQETWQSDIADVSKLKGSNGGFRYILGMIDVFSRKAYCLPMKKKDAATMVKTLRTFFDNSTVKPKLFCTDAGGEYTADIVISLLKSYNIRPYTMASDTGAAIIERFWRTLKKKLYTYMSANRTKKFINILDDVVDSYNRSIHTSHGFAPASVTKEHTEIIRNRLYPPEVVDSKPKFQVGQRVRVRIERKTFLRGFQEQFTQEIFIIESVRIGTPTVFTLKAENGDDVSGTYYAQQMVET